MFLSRSNAMKIGAERIRRAGRIEIRTALQKLGCKPTGFIQTDRETTETRSTNRIDIEKEGT